MNSEIKKYTDSLPAPQKQIVERLIELIHEAADHVVEEFKWGRPVFRKKQDFAYIKSGKSYVSLGFFQFEKLDDRDNRLEGTGKEMRHVKLKTFEDIDPDLFKTWFKAASA